MPRSASELADNLHRYVEALAAAAQRGDDERERGMRELIITVLRKLRAAYRRGECSKRVVSRIQADKATLSRLAASRHRAFLLQHSREYRGVSQPAAARRARRTSCWSCKERLDSSVDLQCNSCGWILCWCGACGCLREKEQDRKR